MTTKSYIVTKDKAQTLTNKLINADSNVIQNLEVGNLKSTAVSTTIPSTGAVDTKLSTEKAVKDALDGKQDVSNLVTSFQATPDNTHYPSEKLVKDSLDGKVDSSMVIIASTDATEQAAGAEPLSNYLNPHGTRITFYADKVSRIVKVGFLYQLDIAFKFNFSGKASWAANTEWLNLLSTTSKFRAIIPYGFYGVMIDPGDGLYGGMVTCSGVGTTCPIWPWKAITDTATGVFKLNATWIGPL